jgi:hypothetical protein
MSQERSVRDVSGLYIGDYGGEGGIISQDTENFATTMIKPNLVFAMERMP